MNMNPRHNIREIRAPRGPELSAKSWMTEAPLRMLMNNLDPDVAENPHELVVYGGIGRAARTWEDFDRITAALKTLSEEETLLVQSGKYNPALELLRKAQKIRPRDHVQRYLDRVEQVARNSRS